VNYSGDGRAVAHTHENVSGGGGGLERWARQRSVINGQVHAPLHLFPATEALFAKIEMRKIMKKKETGKRKETR